MLSSSRVGAALAATAGTLYAACSALYVLAPGFTSLIYRAWFHVGAVAGDAGNGMSPGIFLIGLIAILVVAYVAGALFVTTYNRFNVRKGILAVQSRREPDGNKSDRRAGPLVPWHAFSGS
jgi:2TM family of unknown function (DUF5676)